MAPETIINPLTSEQVTFIRGSSDAQHASTVVEIRLAPRAKGPPLHYHSSVTERFEVVEGELIVRLGAQTIRLQPGQQVTAAVDQVHTFWSESDMPVIFRGTIEPGSPDVEHCFRISFGLARDGLCRQSGIPKNPYHLAIVAAMSQSRLPGVMSVVMGMLTRLARTRKGRTVHEELLRRYCGPGRAEAASVEAVP